MTHRPDALALANIKLKPHSTTRKVEETRLKARRELLSVEVLANEDEPVDAGHVAPRLNELAIEHHVHALAEVSKSKKKCVEQ